MHVYNVVYPCVCAFQVLLLLCVSMFQAAEECVCVFQVSCVSMFQAAEDQIFFGAAPLHPAKQRSFMGGKFET